MTRGRWRNSVDAAEDPHRTGLLALFGATLCMLASPSAQRPAADFERAVRAAAARCVSRAFGSHSRWQAQRTGLDGSRLVELFVDIEGDSRPATSFRTRMKMLWDDEFFYVAADMEEPDLWGTLTARDSVIFHDNDFEVFVDPDGDTHAYYELEVNALGTPWDLMLKPIAMVAGRSMRGTSPA